MEGRRPGDPGGPAGAPPPAAARTVPAVATALPAVGATSDTLLPPQALGASVTPPPPAPPAPRLQAAPVEKEPVAESDDRLDVEITQPPAASAEPETGLPADGEVEALPAAETEPPPDDADSGD